MNTVPEFPKVTRVQETTPVALHHHTCAICGGMIVRGQRHHKIVYRRDDAIDPRFAIRQVRYHFSCPK